MYQGLDVICNLICLKKRVFNPLQTPEIEILSVTTVLHLYL